MYRSGFIEQHLHRRLDDLPKVPYDSVCVSQEFWRHGTTNLFFNYGDGFIVKFTPAGALVYSTFIGSSGDDSVSALAVDSTGNVYFTGATSSTDFGVTAGAFQRSYGGYYTLPFFTVT